MFHPTPRTSSASGEHRNATSPATCSGSTNWLDGWLDDTSAVLAVSKLTPSRAARASICCSTSGVKTQPWADRVAGYARPSSFGRDDLRQTEQPVLAGCVGGLVRDSDVAANRGDVNDAAPIAFQHRGQLALNNQECRRKVHREHGVPPLQREFGYWGDVLDSGAVDQDIYAADSLFDLIDEVLGGGW